jgi:hypothetical protein
VRREAPHQREAERRASGPHAAGRGRAVDIAQQRPLATSSLTRVGATNDRSAIVTGLPNLTVGVAPAEWLLSPAANWYYRPKAVLHLQRKRSLGT